MEQGHNHTESLRSRPVEVSVSATPHPTPNENTGTPQETRVSPPTISPFPEQVAPWSLTQKPH